MSDYTKSTNFASKDSLASGNPLKIVKGTEIDTEFNNIATAIATKTDNAAAAITGGTITGITDLAVADGGTGASTAANARTNLGAAASGANSDITSLSGLTTALSVAQGGTGSTSLTANNVLLGNGTSALQAVAPGTSGNVLTSNGTTWSSAALTLAEIGVSQSWQSVTRSDGTNYQNTTGKPIQVAITFTANSGDSIVFYVGASTGSYVAIGSCSETNNTGSVSVKQVSTFIVPNNHYYKATVTNTSGVGNITSWTELR